MPRYEYKCSECLKIFTIRHSTKETINECKECGSKDTIQKVPTSFLSIKKQKAGTVVSQHIEEVKQDLRHEKIDLRNQEFEP